MFLINVSLNTETQNAYDNSVRSGLFLTPDMTSGRIKLSCEAKQFESLLGWTTVITKPFTIGIRGIKVESLIGYETWL